MKTENEILEMAFYMFLEKGFSAVSTNELIREAGLTKGGFYYSFKSREDLDQRVIEKYLKRFFSLQAEEMQQVWEDSPGDIPTEELLWKGFFRPMEFSNYQRNVGTEIHFRNFYFLLYESMKKFPDVLGAFQTNAGQKEAYLRRILERGQQRGEIRRDIDLEDAITNIITMQGGIQALMVLDDKINDDEKYQYIMKQMWSGISTQRLDVYRDGGVTSAVS